MKPPPRDYLTIAAALIAILACGYGVGFLVGERATQLRLRPDDPLRSDQDPWEELTLERLASELDLTEGQRRNVAREIEASSKIIGRARQEATKTYENEVLDLHRRLLPYLDNIQRNKIEESHRRLQELLDGSS